MCTVHLMFLFSEGFPCLLFSLALGQPRLNSMLFSFVFSADATDLETSPFFRLCFFPLCMEALLTEQVRVSRVLIPSFFAMQRDG